MGGPCGAPCEARLVEWVSHDCYDWLPMVGFWLAGKSGCPMVDGCASHGCAIFADFLACSASRA